MWADGQLYCHFGDYGTVRLDTATGDIVWQTRVSVDHSVGPGSSPVLYDDLLILTCDGVDRQFVTAVDTVSGDVVWTQGSAGAADGRARVPQSILHAARD